MYACGTPYRVLIFDQLGRLLCVVPEDGVSGYWTRALDETSYAEITIDGSCCDCSPIPWAHEIAIYRDGYDEPAWQGPVVSVEDRGTEVFVTANDKSAYWRRRLTTRDHDYLENGVDLAQLFNLIIEDAEQYSPSGLVVPPAQATGINIKRHIEIASPTSPVIDEISQTGLDWSVVGLRVYAGGIRNAPNVPVPLNTRTHWVAQPTMFWDGFGQVTRVKAVGADGLVVYYPDTDTPVVSNTYGVLEIELDYINVTDEYELYLLAYTYWYENNGRQPSLLTLNSGLSDAFPYAIETLVPGKMFSVIVDTDCSDTLLNLQLRAMSGSFEDGHEVDVKIDLLQPTIEEAPADPADVDSVTVDYEPGNVF